jgi:hypothetical protein
MSLSDRDILDRLAELSDALGHMEPTIIDASAEIQSLRASHAKVVAALHDLNVAIDEMWNDVHRFQHWSAHQQLICAAQQAAATALAEKHAKEDEHEPE